VVGLVIGVISAVVTSVGVVSSNDYSVLTNLIVSIGIVLGWIVVYPMIMFLVGWLQGAIFAVIFNVVVSGSGGLNLEVEEGKLNVAKK